MPTDRFDVTADLVERDGDLLALGRVLDAAAAGVGSLMLVSGPAGIGKSALVDVALAGAGGSGRARRPTPRWCRGR